MADEWMNNPHVHLRAPGPEDMPAIEALWSQLEAILPVLERWEAIKAQWSVMSVADLMRFPEVYSAHSMEREFRRGFREGYEQALREIASPARRDSATCQAFLAELEAWEKGDCSHQDYPPEWARRDRHRRRRT